MAPNESIRPLRSARLSSRTSVGSTVALHASVEPLPIWGGVECTHNRVGDRYFDQADLSGHTGRSSDFEAIASLGIHTLRFGMLWERYARAGDWAWTDGCMQAMQHVGIKPVAGLLHHGSGPSHTHLMANDFPEQLARFAGGVAQRYPELDTYTPVNEPNTTARFSGKYGLWYPHHHGAASYLRALLNQVKGTVLSMEAIRRVRSDARLVQTDDVGSITSTPELRSTAELLDHRQWLTFDLLCGTVDRFHPMFEYMRGFGVPESDILWFHDHPCPPDVVGLNYYVTSDRFLDHRTDRYPQDFGSSEGPFVDVEAVRVAGCAVVDFGRPIRKGWSRYGLPVALTEVHLGGHPSEQIRWLVAAYRAAQRARSDGVQCVALTVWALLGSYFWNELVTRDNGHYEAGVFAVHNNALVPTPLADVVHQLARGNEPEHAALSEPGWWQRPERTCYPLAEPGGAEQAA